MIREKIDDCIRRHDLTMVAFYHEVFSATLHPISVRQLSSFRSKKGCYNGNTSPASYVCYMFFEKLWIKEGKVESEDRLKMELWTKKGGFDVKMAAHNKALLILERERFDVNKYGQVKM
jgi:hypothetical protein